MNTILQNNEPDTLQNLDVTSGDVVRCVSTEEDWFTVGKDYVVVTHLNGGFRITDDDGDDVRLIYIVEGKFIIVSRLNSDPIKWGTWSNWNISKQDGTLTRSFQDYETVQLGTTKQVAYRGRNKNKHVPVVEKFVIKCEHNGSTGYGSIQVVDGVPQWNTLKGGDV